MVIAYRDKESCRCLLCVFRAASGSAAPSAPACARTWIGLALSDLVNKELKTLCSMNSVKQTFALCSQSGGINRLAHAQTGGQRRRGDTLAAGSSSMVAS
jgi:hypothetical protein